MLDLNYSFMGLNAHIVSYQKPMAKDGPLKVLCIYKFESNLMMANFF